MRPCVPGCLLWPCCGQGPQLWGTMGLPTAGSSRSFLLKPWLEGSEGDEGPCGNAGSCPLTSSLLGSPYLRPTVKPHGAHREDAGERSQARLWRGFCCQFAAWPGAHPRSSLPLVFLRIPQAYPCSDILCFKSLILGSVHFLPLLFLKAWLSVH